MSDIPLTLRVHQDIQAFKDRKQAVIDLCHEVVVEQSRLISLAERRIDDALKGRDLALGKIGTEFIDYMSERYALEEPAVAPAETLPAETTAPEKVRRTRAPRAAKAPDVPPAVAGPLYTDNAQHEETGRYGCFTELPHGWAWLAGRCPVEPAPDRAVTPPEVATAAIPTDENPNGQVTVTSQGPVVAPANDVVVEVLPFEHWKKTMPTFTKSGGIINLLKSQPVEAWPVLRRAEVAGLNRDSILRLIDAHVLDHQALARKAATASVALAPLDDTDPPF